MKGYQQTAKPSTLMDVRRIIIMAARTTEVAMVSESESMAVACHGIRIEFFPNIMVVTVHVDFYQNGAYQNSHGKQTCVYGFRMQNFGKGSF